MPESKIGTDPDRVRYKSLASPARNLFVDVDRPVGGGLLGQQRVEFVVAAFCSVANVNRHAVVLGDVGIRNLGTDIGRPNGEQLLPADETSEVQADSGQSMIRLRSECLSQDADRLEHFGRSR